MWWANGPDKCDLHFVAPQMGAHRPQAAEQNHRLYLALTELARKTR
ncbi:MAG: hypothetical protein R2911_40570 [Caldilineaceae bacterium]